MYYPELWIAESLMDMRRREALDRDSAVASHLLARLGSGLVGLGRWLEEFDTTLAEEPRTPAGALSRCR
jgi:hypothetical protein